MSDDPMRPVQFDFDYARQRARSAPRGIGRFVGGKFGLDALLRATSQEPEAMDEIRKERAAQRREDREAERRRVGER